MLAPPNRLDVDLSLVSDSTPVYGFMERRSAQRITTPLLVTVRGVDRSGERFRLNTMLDNLSATGLYLRLMRPIELGAALFVVIRFSTTPACEAAAPGVAVHGVVMRAEPQPGSTWGIAMKFTRQRFLYAIDTGVATGI